ncbi:MAG TPA: hypothetical protein VGL56_18940 [Fimbriimonadaceae bacterium]
MLESIYRKARVGHKHYRTAMSKLVTALLLIGAMVSAVAQTATITALPSTFTAYALSRNGKVVVGVDTSTNTAAYWINGTVIDLPGAGSPSAAYSCNVDGSIIVGKSLGQPFTFIRDSFENPFQNLPLLGGTSAGEATLISANGLTIAGYCDGKPVAWEIGGVEGIETGYTSTVLNGVSDDGSTIACDIQGNYSTKTVPNVNTQQSPGLISLGSFDDGPNVIIIQPFDALGDGQSTGFEGLFCLTSDGSTLYGGGYDAYDETFTSNGNPYSNPETHGFVAAVLLPATLANNQLGNFRNFEVHSCSADGSVLAGDQITAVIEPDGNNNPQFVAFDFEGFTDIAFGGNVQDLQQFLSNKGASFPAGNAEDGVSTQAMSADGSVILGTMTPDGTTTTNYLATITPAVTSLNLDQPAFVGGSYVQATVGLDYPAPADSTVNITSDTPAVIPNISVAVPQGTMLGATTLTTTAVTRTTYVNLTATLGQSTTTTFVVVNPALPVITELYPSAGTVVGGNPILGYVDLSFGFGVPESVTITSDNANVQISGGGVSFAAGASAASFAITSTPVTAVTKATITATLANSSVSTVVTVVPPSVSLVRVAPSPVVGGTSTKVAVYLNGMAPTGGLAVKVSSNNSAAVVPATITVPAGATAANAVVTTTAVTSSTPVTINAATGSITVTTNLVVNPVFYPAITGFYPSAGVVVGGNAATASVTLASAAPTGGEVVHLTSNTVGVTVPSSVTVLSGKTSISFSVTSTPVKAVTNVQLTATLGTSTVNTIVTVVPPSVSLVRVAPSPVVGGLSTKVAVYLNGKAPTGGFAVSVASSSSSAVVPAIITVPAGATAANATVTTSKVTAATTVVVTAKTGSTTVETTMVVNP